PTNAPPVAVAQTNAASRATGGGREGRSRPGGGGAGGARPGGPRAERGGPKTIYLADRKVVKGETVIEPKAIQIKTGITDGLSTEVLEGLNEGDEIVVGVILPASDAAKPAANPLGGGGMRRF
ncbi:MAG: hypothetical protein ABIQ35_14870, partial [Verrucomicrobiota bacterium]